VDPECFFSDPESDLTFQVIPEPDPGQNRTFGQSLIRINSKFIWIAVLF